MLAHWNNSPQVDMSLLSGHNILIPSKQSLLFLLNAACLAEKQHIPILKSLVWHDRGSNPQSTALVASMLTITPRAAKRIVGPQGSRKLGSPPPILQIMILKLSPPRCVIHKESVQQKWIDELWYRKQLSICLFVWTLNYNDLVHLLIDVFL